MKNKSNEQLMYLFVSRFAILFVGMGLFPLLPLYAANFGASHTFVGIFFAIMYVSNAMGPVLSGWLADRIGRKRLFVAIGILGIPALVLLGRATALWQVVVLASIVWFAGGLDLALISVFTGLHASSQSRGKSFSLMSLTAPLGALIGGTIAGLLLSRQGYGLMFTAMAAVWTALPVIGMFKLKDKRELGSRAASPQLNRAPLQLGRSFYLVAAISMLAAIAISTSRLGTSLSMQALEFTSSDVASSATVSGLAAIPVTMLIGVLSDRLGRKRLLVLSYLVAAAGSYTLSTAEQLWEFWLAATLLLVAFSANGAMSSALVTDLLKPEALNRGLSWLNASNSAASVLSFSGAGYMMDTFGSQTLFLIAAVLPVISVTLLYLISGKRRLALPAPSAWLRRLVPGRGASLPEAMCPELQAEGC